MPLENNPRGVFKRRLPPTAIFLFLLTFTLVSIAVLSIVTPLCPCILLSFIHILHDFESWIRFSIVLYRPYPSSTAVSRVLTCVYSSLLDWTHFHNCHFYPVYTACAERIGLRGNENRSRPLATNNRLLPKHRVLWLYPTDGDPIVVSTPPTTVYCAANKHEKSIVDPFWFWTAGRPVIRDIIGSFTRKCDGG